MAKRVEGNTGEMVTRGSYGAKVLLDEKGYRDQGVYFSAALRGTMAANDVVNLEQRQ